MMDIIFFIVPLFLPFVSIFHPVALLFIIVFMNLLFVRIASSIAQFTVHRDFKGSILSYIIIKFQCRRRP